MRRLPPAIFRASLLGCSVLAPSAFASQPDPWTHFGLRPLGMGNAYVAVADDFNALFYNPAGLARLKSWDMEIINPFVSASSNVKGLAKDVQDTTKSGEISDTLSLIEKNTGENYGVGLGLTPHWIFPGFGIGAGIEFYAQTEFHRDVTVDLNTGVRAVIPIGFATSFFNNRLSVGTAFKLRAKGGVDQNFSMDDIEAFQNENKDESGKALEDYVKAGTGYGVDVGLLFTPQKEFEPTIGVSITDLGSTAYEKLDVKGDTAGVPSLQLPSVNVGLSAKPFQNSWSYLLASVDMHSINQPYSNSKKVAAGLEYGLGQILKLQTGLYHGYYTAGMQFDIGLINLRLITYAEELGTEAGFKEDRRVAAQLKVLL